MCVRQTATTVAREDNDTVRQSRLHWGRESGPLLQRTCLHLKDLFFQGRCISVLATFSVRLISSWPCGLVPLQRFPSHGGRENASSRVSISAAESGWGFVVQGQKTQGCCLSNLFTPLLGFVVIEKGKKILSLVGRQRRQYGPGPLQGIMKRRRGLQDLVR